MKNLLLIIGLLSTSIVYSQYRTTLNVPDTIQHYLNKYEIFYIGLKDRQDLSKNILPEGYKNTNILDSFRNTYNDDVFLTIPDTDRVLFTDLDLLMNVNFKDEGERFGCEMTWSGSKIVGYNVFNVNDDKIQKIVIYEKVQTGPYLKSFSTEMFLIDKEGKWMMIGEYM